MLEKIVIFGAGGHAKVVIDAIEMAGCHEIAFLADANLSLAGKRVAGYLVRPEKEGYSAVAEGITSAFVAIGENSIRQRIADTAIDVGFVLARVTHPGSIVSRHAILGAGTLVMPGAIINADARIGANVIINTSAIIEHDCWVADHAHIAPRATLCGGVMVGTGAVIGSGAVVLPGVKVGNAAIVGAGAVVLTDVSDGARVAGSPARLF